jgi:hypothetical protein
MKNTKIILLSIISIIAFSNLQLVNAAIEAPQGPGFELYNKASHPITIESSIIGTRFKQMATVAPNGKFPLKIDLDAAITLGIYNPRKTAQEMMLPADYFYTIYSPGKTKYVTWNPAKNPSLYPQTGRFMGFSGISDTGYSLGNNLRASEIIKRPEPIKSDIITFD